jgi:hypothetical protein
LSVLPELQRQIRRTRIRGVLTALHNLAEHRVCEPRALGRFLEVLRGIGRLIAHILDVPTPFEAVLGGLEILHAGLVALRRQQLRVHLVGFGQRGLRLVQEGFPQLVSGGRRASESEGKDQRDARDKTGL